MEGAVYVQPLLPSSSLEDTVTFYRALGFEIVQDMREPYPHVEVRCGDLWLHFSDLRVYGAKHAFGAFMAFVEDAAAYHRRFADGLRNQWRTVPLQGTPRLTRMRQGQTRFRVFDPTGNMLVFIDRAEPEPTGWQSGEEGSALTQALENASFLRDTYANDEAAARVLDKVLAREVSGAPLERARVLAARAELAVALGDEAGARAFESELGQASISPADATRFHAELSAADDLRKWLGTPLSEA